MQPAVLRRVGRRWLTTPIIPALDRGRGILVANSALANPEVMRAADLLSQELAHGDDGMNVSLVRLSGQPYGAGVKVTLDAAEVSSAASILRCLIDDTHGWQVADARGLRRGPSYVLALTNGHVRVGLELKRTSDELVDGEIVLEAQSLTEAHAQAIATAARHDSVIPAGVGGLVDLESLIEPLLQGGGVGAGADAGGGGAARMAAPGDAADAGADGTADAASRRIDRINEGASLVTIAAGSRLAAMTGNASSSSSGGAAPLDALAALCDRVEGLEARRAAQAARSVAAGSATAPAADVDALSTPEAAAAVLAELGAKVVFPPVADTPVDWHALAGADEVRVQVEESLVLPLRHPHALDAITRGTREESASKMAARPAALLFHGPPGTGKTSAARLAAHEAGLPLVYAPLETLVSKWLGQGEQQLASVFEAAHALGPCILFVDELDALAGSREKGESMHEATRRMLSVLLRRMDGFDASDHTALIGATNRRADLDPALLSRFDVQVHFPPPNAQVRAGIFRRYAKHLAPDALERLANAAEGLSGRAILDLCRQVERRWASILLRQQGAGGQGEVTLPPVEQYELAVERRSGVP